MRTDRVLARRTFLQNLLAVSGASLAASYWQQLAAAPNEAELKTQGGTWHYKLAAWTGDNFERGHKLRDAEIPTSATATETTVDFVIIGGGIAGLSSAHYLRDHDFLLLEQYADLGGQSRGGSFQGIDYSWGPASIAVPSGIVEELFQDLNLHPLIMTSSRNSFYFENQWLSDIGSEGNKLYSQFKQFTAQAQPIWHRLKDKQSFIPLADEQLLKLDALPFSQCLKTFTPQFIALVDSMCRSYTCLGMESISQLAGYAVTRDLVLPGAIFKGGNAALARALTASIGNGQQRLQTGAFVWSIEVSDAGVSIVYSDKSDAVHRVQCRYAIITAPPLVTARMLQNVDNGTKAKMLSFKYGSFLVANCLLKKPVFHQSFNNWCPASLPFTNLIVADTPYRQNGEYIRSMGSVLTVYQPYAPASRGRSLLLEGNQEGFAVPMTKVMDGLVQELPGVLEEIIFTRWGHAMVATNIGFFKRMSNLTSATNAPFSLAHNSTQGMPAAESAILAARQAADKAIGKSISVTPLRSFPC